MNNLSERLFRFSISALNLVRMIPYTDSNRVVIHQLTKCSTSVGANYEEAQAAESKSDFIHKVNISLKEIRETNYWLRLIKESNILKREEMTILLNESEELKKILGKIVSTTRQNNSK